MSRLALSFFAPETSLASNTLQQNYWNSPHRMSENQTAIHEYSFYVQFVHHKWISIEKKLSTELWTTLDWEKKKNLTWNNKMFMFLLYALFLHFAFIDALSLASFNFCIYYYAFHLSSVLRSLPQFIHFMFILGMYTCIVLNVLIFPFDIKKPSNWFKNTNIIAYSINFCLIPYWFS